MKLKQGELLALGGRDDVVHRRVDEHAGDLAAPLQGGADLLGHAGIDKRGLSGWWISPMAQAPTEAACSASSRLVIPQILIRVIAHKGRRRANNLGE